MCDFLDIGGDGRPVVDIRKAKRRGRAHVLIKLVVNRDGTVRIEVHDALVATGLLAQYHKLIGSDPDVCAAVDLNERYQRAARVIETSEPRGRKGTGNTTIG